MTGEHSASGVPRPWGSSSSGVQSMSGVSGSGSLPKVHRPSRTELDGSPGSRTSRREPPLDGRPPPLGRSPGTAGPRQPLATDRQWDPVAVYAPDELTEEEFQDLYATHRPHVAELGLKY